MRELLGDVKWSEKGVEILLIDKAAIGMFMSARRPCREPNQLPFLCSGV